MSNGGQAFARIPPYLKRNRLRVLAAIRGGERKVKFIPFGESMVEAADVSDMVVRLRGSGVSIKRQAAACLLIPFGWTIRYSKIIGVPPAQWNPHYQKRLERAFVNSYRRQICIHNPSVRSCAARSFLNCGTLTQARQKIRQQIDHMRAAVGAVDLFLQMLQDAGCDGVAQRRISIGFPKGGYTLRCALVLWRQLHSTVWSDHQVPVLPMSEKVAETLADITNTCASDVKANVFFGSLLVNVVASEIRKHWQAFGPRVALPRFDGLNLVGQLCAWRSDGLGEEVNDFPTIVDGLRLS